MFTALTVSLPRTRLFWRPTALAAPASDRDRSPVVLTIAEACATLRISKWSLYQLIRSGRLTTIKIGSRRVVPVAAIHRLVDALEDEGVV